MHSTGRALSGPAGGWRDAGDVETFDGDDPPGTVGEDRSWLGQPQHAKPLGQAPAMAAACSKPPASIGGNQFGPRPRSCGWRRWRSVTIHQSHDCITMANPTRPAGPARAAYAPSAQERNLHGGWVCLLGRPRSASGQGAFRRNDGSSGGESERGRPLLRAVPRLNSVWSIPIAWIGPIRLGSSTQRPWAIVSLTARHSPTWPMARRRPCHQSISTHRHHMRGCKRGGRSPRQPRCNGPRRALWGLSGFLPSDGGRSGSRGCDRWPRMMARLDRTAGQQSFRESPRPPPTPLPIFHRAWSTTASR